MATMVTEVQARILARCDRIRIMSPPEPWRPITRSSARRQASRCTSDSRHQSQKLMQQATCPFNRMNGLALPQVPVGIPNEPPHSVRLPVVTSARELTGGASSTQNGLNISPLDHACLDDPERVSPMGGRRLGGPSGSRGGVRH